MDGHYLDCLNPADCWCEVRRLARVGYVALVILTAEIIGGLVSGSLALLADAGHVLADNTAIAVAITVAMLVKVGFRKRKVRSVGFWVNVALLFGVVTWVIFEAIERLYDEPREVIGPIVVGVAAFGGFLNFVQHRILKGSAAEHRHNLHGSLSLHILSDFWMSVGVVISGIVIWITGWSIIDPLLSVGIVVWIAWRTVGVVRNRNQEPNPHNHH